LNEFALNAGLLFGAAAGPPPLSDPAYQALYLQHCGIITTDIALKWSRVRPTRDMVPVFGPADDLINWALANDIKVKGHNLAWNENNPAWLWTSNTTAPDFGVLNVTADPNAKLFMNEQAIERFGMEKNRVLFLNLVDRLLGKGVPLHGIGFESHIIKWTGGVSHEGVMWLLGELQKRNLEVHISEFDVSVFGGSNGALDHSITDPTVIDPFAAAFARPYIRDVLSFSNVKAFISWELSDKYSDLLQDQQRPTLFDANMRPKQLALEVESAIQDRHDGSWRTPHHPGRTGKKPPHPSHARFPEVPL
jgi:GH35 family endo-1,4-beta-xylanase